MINIADEDFNLAIENIKSQAGKTPDRIKIRGEQLNSILETDEYEDDCVYIFDMKDKI